MEICDQEGGDGEMNCHGAVLLKHCTVITANGERGRITLSALCGVYVKLVIATITSSKAFHVWLLLFHNSFLS